METIHCFYLEFSERFINDRVKGYQENYTNPMNEFNGQSVHCFTDERKLFTHQIGLNLVKSLLKKIGFKI